MVQTVHVTGIASARTTGISMGGWLGRGRVAVITAIRQIMDRSHAQSIHALSIHALSLHALSIHALSMHALSMHNIAVTGATAWDTRLAIMISRGTLATSSAGAKNFPMRTGVATGVVTIANPTGAATGAATARAQMGQTMTNYTIDSYGRYVAAATHPAANHAVLKGHGAAGPRIELGNALRNTDILEITTLMQAHSGGVF